MSFINNTFNHVQETSTPRPQSKPSIKFTMPPKTAGPATTDKQSDSKSSTNDWVSDPKHNILLAMLKHASNFNITTDWNAVAKEQGLDGGKAPVAAA